jgi:hypothetical protein
VLERVLREGKTEGEKEIARKRASEREEREGEGERVKK